MCGVLGFYNVSEITLKLLRGLSYLQRRGFDSTGICVNGEMFKVVGKVDDLKKEVPREKYEIFGSGIGHVRYSTSGTNLQRDAQPLYKSEIKSLKPRIVLAHNGEVLNLDEIKNKYPNYGFSTECDLEGILAILYSNLNSDENEDIYFAIKKVMEEVKGAYSVVGMVNDKMIAFRDPKGIRPLVRTKNAFASESLPLEELLDEEVYDVNPGSLIILSENGEREYQIFNDTHYHCGFEYNYFAHQNSKINGISVMESRERIGKVLSKYIKPNTRQIIVPIPHTPIPIADSISNITGIPKASIVSKETKERIFQKSENDRRNSWIYYTISDSYVGKVDEIILVDDSIVRGTNMKGIIKKIRKKYGDVKITVLSGFPKVIGPCPFGIDMKTKNELIGFNKSDGEIAKEIGADEVHYISVEEYKEAIGINLCMGCTTGNYPGIDDNEIERMEKRRIMERKVIK